MSDSMFEEDDLLPLSALQHLIFCERQAALIHLERIWLDNAFTVEGTAMHEIADAGKPESRAGILIRRGVALRSVRLGLIGKADVVEFHRAPEGMAGACLENEAGLWRVVPVEYKRGKPKAHRADEVQVCAQALCLEEALAVVIAEGAIFYGRTRRRQTVQMTGELRELTRTTAERLHTLIRSRRTPICAREPKCEHCSLLPACLPPDRMREPSAKGYMASVLEYAGHGHQDP